MEWLQTYKIGKALLESGNFEPVDAYFQNYKPSKKKVQPYDKRNARILSLNIDLRNNFISSTLESFDPQRIKTDNFFASVTAKTKNYYLCTKLEKVDFILNFFSNDFKETYENLIKEGLLDDKFKNTDLIKYLNNCSDINNALIEYIDNLKDNIRIYNLNLGDKGIDEISFVVTKLITIENNEIYLNRLVEYREFCYNRFLSLAKINSKTEVKGKCYFTGEDKVFAVAFPRDAINILKISTNTSITSIPYFKGNKFFASRNAFDALKLGAKYIDNNLKIRIAGISHYIIPDFHFNIKPLSLKTGINDKIELAFKLKEFRNVQQQLYLLNENNINSISFIGFNKNDKEINIINRIERISQTYFNEIMLTFQKSKKFLIENLKYNPKKVIRK